MYPIQKFRQDILPKDRAHESTRVFRIFINIYYGAAKIVHDF